MSGRFDSTRWSMVLRAVGQDPNSRDVFGRQYGPVVRAYLAARWAGNPPLRGDLDDAVQEVFVQCFRPDGALERLDPARPGRFRSYLYAVTAHVAVDLERKHARRRDKPMESGEEVDPPGDPRETPARAFDRAWALMVQEEAFELMLDRGGVSARRRIAILHLRHIEGVPARDIAVRVGIDVEEVYRMLKTGRSHFRAAMLTVMATYHPGESESELVERCRKLTELI